MKWQASASSSWHPYKASALEFLRERPRTDAWASSGVLARLHALGELAVKVRFAGVRAASREQSIEGWA